MTTLPTFVVFGDDWGRHVSTMQHLFARILDRADVIWVQSIGHREPTLSLRDMRRAWEKVAARAKAGSPVEENGQDHDGAPAIGDVGEPRIIVHPHVVPLHSWRIVRALNRRSLVRDIRSALAQLGHPRDVVIVTGTPPSNVVIGDFGERAAIYFIMDDFLEIPGTSPRMLKPLEEDLLRKVDAVVATAASLVAKKRNRTGRGYHLPQGVNFEHFSTGRALPADLAALPRPLIGFAGGVGPAVDVPTLQGLADAYPQGTVVLVGPVTLPADSFARPNIVTLGPRPYSVLPAYVQHFDVGIIPYLESEWTRGVDPLKLLEYLATGIPVVASPLPEVHKYASTVRIAPLGDSFVGAVREALTAPASERSARVACAQANTWERRAEQFLDIVNEVLASSSHIPSLLT